MGLAWSKPFAAAWRARAYFIIAIIFWIMNSLVPMPFSTIPAAEKAWWQDLLAKGVGSLDKISYLSFLAGLIYAVLSDSFDYIWSNSLITEVRRGVAELNDVMRSGLSNFGAGLHSLSFEAVKVWIEGGRGTPDQVRAVAISALKSYYGPHHSRSDNLVDFVLDDVLQNCAFPRGQTWSSYVTNITLRSSEIHGHFEWEERRSYDVNCPSASGIIPLRLETSAKVAPDQVLKALDQMSYRITLENQVIIDFQRWWSEKAADVAGNKTFKIEDDGIIANYDGAWLTFNFFRDCVISHEQTRVVIYEKSYLSHEDRCYAMAMRHPVNDLRVALSIEGLSGWIVKTPVISAKLYEKGERVVAIEPSQARTCSARIRGWTLPGLAVVIEWAPE